METSAPRRRPRLPQASKPIQPRASVWGDRKDRVAAVPHFPDLINLRRRLLCQAALSHQWGRRLEATTNQAWHAALPRLG